MVGRTGAADDGGLCGALPERGGPGLILVLTVTGGTLTDLFGATIYSGNARGPRDFIQPAWFAQCQQESAGSSPFLVASAT